MRVILFGATGHIGQGVLIECLESPDVESVLVIGRRNCWVVHDKLKEIIHDDFTDLSGIAHALEGYGACFFCLGVSSVGMSELEYHKITHDYAVEAGEVLSARNPEMVFCFVSGAGTDTTLQSKRMWARVKGLAENSLKTLPFRAVYLFRPAYVQPVKGVRTTYTWYKFLKPLYPLWRLLFPRFVITTAEMGQAMINAVLYGSEKQTLESRDIKRLAHKDKPAFAEQEE